MSYSISQGGGASINAASRSSQLFGGSDETAATSTTPSATYQTTIGVAGVFSHLAVFINDSGGTSRTANLYINGSIGNQQISIANGATGWFEDASNTDSVSAGDEVELNVTRSATTFTVSNARVRFTPSSGHASILFDRQSGSASSGTKYYGLSGRSTLSTTETPVKITMRTAGTFKYMSAEVFSNSSTSTSNIRLRKNGGNGNQLIAVSAGATGRFTDTSNTDTYADGDEFNYSLSDHNNTVNISVLCITLVGDTAAFPMMGGGPFTRAASASTHIYNLGSVPASSGSPGKRFQFGAPKPVKVDKLQVRVSANSYTGSCTFKSSKNGSDGNQLITITTGATGTFEDTSNSDSFDDEDTFGIDVTGGTSGNLTTQGLAVRAEVIENTPFSQAYFYG